jgi:ribosomal protein L3 glutamine methyltransferase
MTDAPLPAEAPARLGDAIALCEAQLLGSDIYLGHGTDNAWDEAVQLVLAACKLPADSGSDVVELPVTAGQWQQIRGWLAQRIEQRIPLPYITGNAWFAGLEFHCDQRALVPRSPLAELILDDYQPWYTGPGPTQILDLCCGGGSIGIAAAFYRPELNVDLADIDADALALAAENVALHGLQQRVQCIQSDLFGGLPQKRYDLILSNPPYVDADDLAGMPAEYHREPPRGLGSGPDGLDITRRILALAIDYLADTGLLVVEVGNSWEALEAAYPDVPFTWIEFAQGGHGVFVISACELQEYGARLRR